MSDELVGTSIYPVALGSNISWDSKLPALIDGSAYIKDSENMGWLASDDKTWLHLQHSTNYDPPKESNLASWNRRLPDHETVDYAFRGVMNVYVSGNRYQIPDIWCGLHSAGNGVTFWSNWRTYTSINAWESGKTTTVYGYRDADKNKPWALELRTDNVGGQVRVNLVELGPIVVDGTAPMYNMEFDLRLAEKRLAAHWDFNVTTMFPQVANTDYLVLDEPTNLDVSFAQAISDKPASTQPEFTAKAVLRNGTDYPLVMRSSDFAHAYADALTVSWAYTYKFAVKFAAKFKAGLPIIGEAETTIEINNEFSWTWGQSSTHTETKTYTIPGQNMSVPANTTLEVGTVWNRTTQSGKLKAYCALGAAATGKRVNKTATVNVTGDWQKVIDTLGLKGISTNPAVGDATHHGYYAVLQLNFSSNSGTVGEVAVKELKA